MKRQQTKRQQTKRQQTRRQQTKRIKQMKIEKVDLNDVKNTLTRIALMKACENNSHDVLINIYFTKTNDSFNLVTFDAFV